MKLLRQSLAAALLCAPLVAHAQAIYGTADLLRNTAVVDVAGTGPNGQASAKAQVVASGGAGLTADQMQGNIAADAPDTGNPVKIGCSNVGVGSGSGGDATGDRVNCISGPAGQMIVSSFVLG